MTAPELKPCPFCGGEAEFSLGKTGDGKDWHYIECVNCGATGPLVNYADHNIAINDALADAWNRRADLAASPAQVRVKPLVWYEGDEPDEWKSGPYDVWCELGRFQVYHWSIIMGEPHETADAAKSAAQDDYEARIRATLEPQPDPRDEVIKGLVEELEWCIDALKQDYRGSAIDCEIPKDVYAAIAAAKAVLK